MFVVMCIFWENCMYLVVVIWNGYRYVVRNFLLMKILNLDIFLLIFFLFVCLMVSLKGFLKNVLLNLLFINWILWFYLFCLYVFKSSMFGGLGLKWNKMFCFLFGWFVRKLIVNLLKLNKIIEIIMYCSE